jgi:heat shock protein HslJ/uncharacterized lipoprotein YbaY
MNAPTGYSDEERARAVALWQRFDDEAGAADTAAVAAWARDQPWSTGRMPQVRVPLVMPGRLANACRRSLAACGLLALGALAGCAGPVAREPAMLTVKGTLVAREHVGLPAGSVAIVEVRDASRPEGSGVVAEQRIDLKGRAGPIPFRVEVDPRKLEADRPYAVRGGVTVGGRPAWITSPLPLASRSGVIDLGELALMPLRIGAFPIRFQCGEAAMTIDFLGERARLTVGQTEYEMRQTRTADGARFEAVNDATTWFWNRGRGGTLSWQGQEYPECRQVDTTLSELMGAQWVVEDIDHAGIIDRSRATLAFGADGQLSGRGGCNTYAGHYEVRDNTVRISGVVGTMRECSPALMNQERRFYAVLRDATRVQVRADGALVLHTDDRRSIVTRRERRP